MSFKKIMGWLHLWLGLAAGSIIVLLGITGAILVFEEEIKSISSPWWHVEKPKGGVLLPPSQLYKAIADALPGEKVHSIWYHGAERSAVCSINSDTQVYINPYTAAIVAMKDHEDFFHFIDEGHTHLWLPGDVGTKITGWATFLFLILLISGLVLWLPKKWNRSTRNQSFKIKWKARFKRLNYDLHNVLGFYSMLIGLLFAVTGLIMSFPWFASGIYLLSGGENVVENRNKVETETEKEVPASLATIDLVWRKTQADIAEFNPQHIIVSFPEKASEAIYVCTDMHRGAWRDLYFSHTTGELLPESQCRMKDAAAATWLRRSNYGLHVGAIGGAITKILFFIASLICASLPITGFYIWWGKKKKSKQKKKTRIARHKAVHQPEQDKVPVDTGTYLFGKLFKL